MTSPPVRARARLVVGLVLAILGLAPFGDGPAAAAAAAGPTYRSDVLVYGATPGGVLAAVTASRAGASVTLLEPTRHLGGMMSSGLSWTDIGDKTTLGGYTRQLFDRIAALEGSQAARYAFEPHIAEAAFASLLHSTSVSVRYGQRLAERGRIGKDGTRITWIRTTTGTTYRASVFIDASYEGDLMARAGVSFRVGRESSSEYGESLGGVQPALVIVADPMGARVPYVRSAPGPVGSADGRIQDANYRMCFSDDPANQVPFAQPAGYDRADYEIVLRFLAEREVLTGQSADLSWLLKLAPLAARKYDVNDNGLMSTAIPGLGWSWSALDVPARALIAAKHRQNSAGLFWFLANDPAVPDPVQTAISAYGLCADEFTDNDHWPPLLYVRETRRMVGTFVLTQEDVTSERQKADIIGIGSYRIDAHLVSRWIDAQGRLMGEGPLSGVYQDYAIPYGVIVPQADEATNLLVPVAASASHVAHSSLRMEPHYLLMGEAAGEAAAMAIRRGRGAVAGVAASTDVQLLDVSRLQARLKAHGAKLTNPP